MKRAKVIVSQTPPEIETVVPEEGQPYEAGAAGIDVGFLWFQPDPGIFYQVTSLDPLTWSELVTQGNVGNINFVGTVQADGSTGITGNRTLGGYTITFKKGLLTGFAQT